MIDLPRWWPLAAFLTVFMTACDSEQTTGSARAKLPGGEAEQRLLVLPRPPLIEADNPYDLSVARRILATLTPEELRRRQGAKMTGANSIAYLSGSRVGREFLSYGERRVLVRGRPAKSCPVALARNGDTASGVAELAATALTECLDLTPRQGCGCQVVAIGSVLMVPIGEMAYATGTTARIRAPSIGLDGFLVAEEDNAGTVLLRDLSGPVGELIRAAEGTVTLHLHGSAEAFEGVSRPVGFRRGRVAERIYVSNARGDRISLLIGFEPSELASGAAGWLVWPKDG